MNSLEGFSVVGAEQVKTRALGVQILSTAIPAGNIYTAFLSLFFSPITLCEEDFLVTENISLTDKSSILRSNFSKRSATPQSC